MIKKTLMTLGLLGAMALSGCVVAPPPGAYVYGPPGPVVVAPIFPVYGYYGGYYHYHGWGGYGYRGYRGGGHWR